MITVHHLDHSRSQRILWLLEELGAPYEVLFYQRDAQTRSAPTALKTVHPLGKSPVVSDGPLVLAESGLITEYLCDRFSAHRLAPPKSLTVESPERLHWLYWVHYAEGSAMAPLLLRLLIGGIDDPAVTPLKTGFINRELLIHADYWEAGLAATGWFAGGHFSAADIMMSFPIEAAERFGCTVARPNVEAFLARIRNRAAYLRAQERGLSPNL
jgi:glutathione S-transferase